MGTPAPIGVSASGLPPARDQANAVVSGSLAAVGPTAPFAFRGPANLAIFASVVTTLTTVAGSFAASVLSATGLAAGVAINSSLVPPGTTIGSITGTDIVLAIPPITLRGTGIAGQTALGGLASTDGLLGAAVSGPGVPAGTTVAAITTAAASNQNPPVLGVVELSAALTETAESWAPEPFVFVRTGGAILVSDDDAAATFTGAGIAYVGTVQLERSFDGCATWIVCNSGGTGSLAQFSAGTPVSTTFGEPEKEVFYRLNVTDYSSGTINYRLSTTGVAAESLALQTVI